MDRDVIEFPARLFVRTSFAWDIDVRGRAANPGITGSGQVIYGNQPRWVADLEYVTRKDQGLAWRSTMDRLRGRINVLRVPVCDLLRLSAAAIGSTTGEIPHDDDTLFDDDTGYVNGMTAPILVAASAGDTTLSFDAGYFGDAFSGGHMFSINDWLYRATMVEGEGEEAVVTFEPPLRRAVVVGDEIDLNATALMALGDDRGGALSHRVAKRGSASLSLVEWTGPDRE